MERHSQLLRYRGEREEERRCGLVLSRSKACREANQRLRCVLAWCYCREVARSEFLMEAKAGNPDRTAIAVVSGIVDMLQIRGSVNSSPDMSVVVGLYDILATIGEIAIAKKKAQPA